MHEYLIFLGKLVVVIAIFSLGYLAGGYDKATSELLSLGAEDKNKEGF